MRKKLLAEILGKFFSRTGGGESRNEDATV